VQPVAHIGSFDRANLTYRVLPRVQFKQQLQTILRRHDGEAGIIYCLSRREVDELAATLSSDGIRALPYHAGLDDATRHRNQDAFLNERVDVMVATVAFGMGIDRSDVRFVVHAGAPQSLEQYQQEAGRAGRDGLPAECALVTSPPTSRAGAACSESDGQWTDSARTLLRDMERYAAATSCRHRRWSATSGRTSRRARAARATGASPSSNQRRAKSAGAEGAVGGRADRTTMGCGARGRRAPRRVD
jgi:ATP-dependent DNA helicase RecQ